VDCADVHNADSSLPKPALPLLQIISTISIHIAQHAKQIEGNSLPSLHPDNSLFHTKANSGEKKGHFPRGNKSYLPIQNRHGGFGAGLPVAHVCTWVSPLDAYLQSHCQLHRSHLPKSKTAIALFGTTGDSSGVISWELRGIRYFFSCP
jgi:hypothetical protein